MASRSTLAGYIRRAMHLKTCQLRMTKLVVLILHIKFEVDEALFRGLTRSIVEGPRNLVHGSRFCLDFRDIIIVGGLIIIPCVRFRAESKSWGLNNTRLISCSPNECQQQPIPIIIHQRQRETCPVSVVHHQSAFRT